MVFIIKFVFLCFVEQTIPLERYWRSLQWRRAGFLLVSFFLYKNFLNTDIYFLFVCLHFHQLRQIILFGYFWRIPNLSKCPSIYAFSHATNVESIFMFFFLRSLSLSIILCCFSEAISNNADFSVLTIMPVFWQKPLFLLSKPLITFKFLSYSRKKGKNRK